MIDVHGWEISQQMVLTGAVVGLSYSAIAAGLILVYRANGIINFAVVAFGGAALGLFGVLFEHGGACGRASSSRCPSPRSWR